MKVMIVGPNLKHGLGGVANYYNAVLPKLKTRDISLSYLETGSENASGKYLYILTDQLRHFYSLIFNRPTWFTSIPPSM